MPKKPAFLPRQWLDPEDLEQLAWMDDPSSAPYLWYRELTNRLDAALAHYDLEAARYYTALRLQFFRIS